MERNMICSTCQTDQAEVVCFCSYPLVQLCTQCLRKHLSLPTFHFQMPCSILPFITRENFTECQARLSPLLQAQQRLRDSLALVDTFAAEMEQACVRIQQTVEVLRQEYKQAASEWRQAASVLIEAAIAETTSQAFSAQPQFNWPLSEWIWWQLVPTAGIQLCHTSLHLPNRQDILQLLSVKVSVSPLLPQFPLASVEIQRPWLQFSGPICVSTVFPLRPPTLSRCLTCESKCTAEDRSYQCPHSCQCRRCVTQSLICHSSPCPFCSQPYSPTAVSQATQGYMSCHVCGLAVPIEEIEFAAECHLCRQCVTTSETTIFDMTLWITGTCNSCEASFRVEKKNYRVKGRALIDREGRVRGCCEHDSVSCFTLPCGHYACGTHRVDLKQCRSCQRKVGRR